MQITQTKLPGVVLFTPKRFGDHRGWFSETYNQRILADNGFNLNLVQDNQSFSATKGTLRGLHYQTPPFAQDKLVRVLKGRIVDVAVDIRRGSPHFGQHVAVELDAVTGTQILVPAGFAHGILTLEPDTEIFYKVTNFYSAPNDRGIRWNDPALGITWPIPEADIVLSDKDKAQPLFADADIPFTYSA